MVPAWPARLAGFRAAGTCPAVSGTRPDPRLGVLTELWSTRYGTIPHVKAWGGPEKQQG